MLGRSTHTIHAAKFRNIPLLLKATIKNAAYSTATVSAAPSRVRAARCTPQFRTSRLTLPRARVDQLALELEYDERHALKVLSSRPRSI